MAVMSTATGRDRTVAHAAERWARAVVLFLASDHDANNLEEWGHIIGASRGAIKMWCRAAHVSAKDSLSLARLLRAIVKSQGQACDLFNTLDIVDERTLERMFRKAGIPDLVDGHAPPELPSFLSQQRLVQNQTLLAVLAIHLQQHGITI